MIDDSDPKKKEGEKRITKKERKEKTIILLRNLKHISMKYCTPCIY